MWFYAAISMAFLSGLYVVISKHTLRAISPIIFFWSVLLISTPIVFIYAWKDGFPKLTLLFFVGVLGSVIFYTISKLWFYKIIKDSHLSQVHPLVSLSPIITLLFAIPILGERPSGLAVVGSMVSLLGVYVLNISSLREGLFEPFKILFRNKMAFLMLASVMVGGIVSVFDKLAINNTTPNNSAFALLMEDIVIVVGLLPYMYSKRKIVFTEIFSNKKFIILLGIIGAASNILGFIALDHADSGIATAVFRTQTFFVLFFSFLFFKDRPKLETVIGATIMIAGLLIIKLAT
jgi:drug/metabolite transporter (DMT)-like permease